VTFLLVPFVMWLLALYVAGRDDRRAELPATTTGGYGGPAWPVSNRVKDPRSASAVWQ
jgi:hypothetical protein